MDKSDAQLALMQWTAEKREALADDYALEIVDSLGEAVAVTREAVINSMKTLNAQQEETLYPTLTQVLEALKALDIHVVEETVAQVEAACEDLSPLYRRAATDVAFIVKEAAQDGANTYLEALKVRQAEIRSKIKSLKPSGAMLKAEKIYEALIAQDARVSTLPTAEAAKTFFLATFKD